MDLVLSSGFLAFARHCGFLSGVEEAGLPVGGLCGTSSGALVGALWLAGFPAARIAEELSADAPIRSMSPRLAVWGGVFSMDKVLVRLREWLPPRFDDLGRPFGVGVLRTDGAGELVTSGSLPEAVAASCAVPYLFAKVPVDGRRLGDGGAVDRLFLSPWRAHRGLEVAPLVHLVDRSAGAPTDVPDDVAVVRTPRSGAKFWNLGDFEGQMEDARRATRTVVEALPGPTGNGCLGPPGF